MGLGLVVIKTHDYRVEMNGTRATLIKDDDLYHRNPNLAKDILETLKNAASVDVKANEEYSTIVNILKDVALDEASKSFLASIHDLFVRIFSCFDLKTTAEKINESADIAIARPVVFEKDLDPKEQIKQKLSFLATYKDAYPLILKLSANEIKAPFKAYFEACLKFNDDESAKEALEKCLISPRLYEEAYYNDLLDKYNAWKNN